MKARTKMALLRSQNARGTHQMLEPHKGEPPPPSRNVFHRQPRESSSFIKRIPGTSIPSPSLRTSEYAVNCKMKLNPGQTINETPLSG